MVKRLFIMIPTVISFVFSVELNANNARIETATQITKAVQEAFTELVFYSSKSDAEKMLVEVMRPLRDEQWRNYLSLIIRRERAVSDFEAKKADWLDSYSFFLQKILDGLKPTVDRFLKEAEIRAKRGAYTPGPTSVDSWRVLKD